MWATVFHLLHEKRHGVRAGQVQAGALFVAWPSAGC